MPFSTPKQNSQLLKQPLSASAPALQPRKKTVFIPYTAMKERISTCRRTRYWVLTAARLLLRL